MEKRSLGRTGIEVGVIGLGTWGLSGEAYGPVAPEDVGATLRTALDEGGNFVETAACYAEGAIESRIGELLRGRGRDAVVVSTRVGVDRSVVPPRKRFGADEVTAACEDSLRRIGTDHVDVLVLHNPRPETVERGEATAALARLREAGKTRATGVSAGSLAVARAAVRAGVDVLVLPYNLLHPRTLHALSGDISAHEIGVIVRSPLAYGMLAGSWGADRRFGDDDHRNHRWGPGEFMRRIRQREAARALVHDDVRSLREAALRYVLANGLVAVAAVGARTPDHARQNAHAVDTLPYLPEGDLAEVGRIMSAVGVET